MTTPTGLTRYDGYTATEAIIIAWTMTGPDAATHADAKQLVRELMPLLGRALDRLSKGYPHEIALQWARQTDAREIFISAGALMCPNLEHQDLDLMDHPKMEDVVLYVKEHFECEALPNDRING